MFSKNHTAIDHVPLNDRVRAAKKKVANNLKFASHITLSRIAVSNVKCRKDENFLFMKKESAELTDNLEPVVAVFLPDLFPA